MIAKTFEIRDKRTFTPVLAVCLYPGSEQDRFLFAHAGYGVLPENQAEYILLCQIEGGDGKCSSDPHSFGGRTYPVAHQYIIENFGILESGAVVDVEFILGETTEPKKSEAKEL